MRSFLCSRVSVIAWLLGTWLAALDAGEGSLNKKADFYPHQQPAISLIRNKVAGGPVGGGIWVTGALRTLHVVPRNVLHALPHQPPSAQHLTQFVVQQILHTSVCVASSRCGLKPLAQQVHLNPHLAKPMSATPLLCVPLFFPIPPGGRLPLFLPMNRTFIQHSKIH